MPLYNNQCPVCNKSCKSTHCYKHDPNTLPARKAALSKYRQSDKGKEIVKKIYLSKKQPALEV